MASPTPSSANEFIEQQLDIRIEALEKRFGGHALSFCGPLIEGVDNIVRYALEKRCSSGPDSKHLAFVLTTTGGYLEVVRRIVEVLRRHYDLIDFIVPDHAYSAGTVLVMSGDAIHMDYYSRLGPIDPQVEGSDGRLRPALGYLERYNALIKKAQEGEITLAEVQLLVNGFDQADLYQYDHARQLSIALVKEWLVSYKFKNWEKTETQGKAVTSQMRKARATAIAKQLNNTKKWHTHGHGISAEVLRRDLNLKIDDFEANPDLNCEIRAYYSLLDDYMGKVGYRGLVHTKCDYSPFYY
jgi:hypothetical protein